MYTSTYPSPFCQLSYRCWQQQKKQRKVNKSAMIGKAELSGLFVSLPNHAFLPSLVEEEIFFQLQYLFFKTVASPSSVCHLFSPHLTFTITFQMSQPAISDPLRMRPCYRWLPFASPQELPKPQDTQTGKLRADHWPDAGSSNPLWGITANTARGFLPEHNTERAAESSGKTSLSNTESREEC